MTTTLWLLALGLVGVSYADTLPWAATQPLEAITGLVLPPGWEDQAEWKTSFSVSEDELPEFHDVRFYAAGLTPVRRQRAGDCWAQGTVAVLESLVKLQLGKEVQLSVQEVISCSKDGTARGGGMFAHDYHLRSGAVVEEDFPYTARDIPCRRGLKPAYRLKRWGYIGKKGRHPTTTEMKQAILEHGVIGVTISANGALQNFRGDGVFKGCSNGQTNHIEAVVGWDDKEGGGVWFVRNSWGTSHGQDGYAKIPYGCSKIGYTSTWADLEM